MNRTSLGWHTLQTFYPKFHKIGCLISGNRRTHNLGAPRWARTEITLCTFRLYVCMCVCMYGKSLKKNFHETFIGHMYENCLIHFNYG
jgi:hypothetical protein